MRSEHCPKTDRNESPKKRVTYFNLQTNRQLKRHRSNRFLPWSYRLSEAQNIIFDKINNQTVSQSVKQQRADIVIGNKRKCKLFQKKQQPKTNREKDKNDHQQFIPKQPSPQDEVVLLGQKQNTNKNYCRITSKSKCLSLIPSSSERSIQQSQYKKQNQLQESQKVKVKQVSLSSDESINSEVKGIMLLAEDQNTRELLNGWEDQFAVILVNLQEILLSPLFTKKGCQNSNIRIQFIQSFISFFSATHRLIKKQLQSLEAVKKVENQQVKNKKVKTDSNKQYVERIQFLLESIKNQTIDVISSFQESSLTLLDILFQIYVKLYNIDQYDIKLYDIKEKKTVRTVRKIARKKMQRAINCVKINFPQVAKSYELNLKEFFEKQSLIHQTCLEQDRLFIQNNTNIQQHLVNHLKRGVGDNSNVSDYAQYMKNHLKSVNSSNLKFTNFIINIAQIKDYPDLVQQCQSQIYENNNQELQENLTLRKINTLTKIAFCPTQQENSMSLTVQNQDEINEDKMKEQGNLNENKSIQVHDQKINSFTISTAVPKFNER